MPSSYEQWCQDQQDEHWAQQGLEHAYGILGPAECFRRLAALMDGNGYKTPPPPVPSRTEGEPPF